MLCFEFLLLLPLGLVCVFAVTLLVWVWVYLVFAFCEFGWLLPEHFRMLLIWFVFMSFSLGFVYLVVAMQVFGVFDCGCCFGLNLTFWIFGLMLLFGYRVDFLRLCGLWALGFRSQWF